MTFQRQMNHWNGVGFDHRDEWTAHHGFVRVSPSLELDGAEGVGGAELGVFADGPFLRQAVVLGQALRLVVLTGGDARGQPHMLANQTAATAPEGGEARRCEREGGDGGGREGNRGRGITGSGGW